MDPIRGGLHFPPESRRERDLSIRGAGRGEAHRPEVRGPAGRGPSETPSAEPHGLVRDASIGAHSAGLIRPECGDGGRAEPSTGSATMPQRTNFTMSGIEKVL